MLVWKTNFDAVDNREVLRSQWKRPTTTPQPHTHDPPPQSHVTSRGHAHELDANRAPLDHVTQPPSVVNVGPQLFHKPHPLLEEDIDGELLSPPDRSHNRRMGGAHSQTTPLEQMTMPPQLTNTLEHIVGQLDILTQVQSQYTVDRKFFHCTYFLACEIFVCLIFTTCLGSSSNLYSVFNFRAFNFRHLGNRQKFLQTKFLDLR